MVGLMAYIVVVRWVELKGEYLADETAVPMAAMWVE